MNTKKYLETMNMVNQPYCFKKHGELKSHYLTANPYKTRRERRKRERPYNNRKQTLARLKNVQYVEIKQWYYKDQPCEKPTGIDKLKKGHVLWPTGRIRRIVHH